MKFQKKLQIRYVYWYLWCCLTVSRLSQKLLTDQDSRVKTEYCPTEELWKTTQMADTQLCNAFIRLLNLPILDNNDEIHYTQVYVFQISFDFFATEFFSTVIPIKVYRCTPYINR